MKKVKLSANLTLVPRHAPPLACRAPSTRPMAAAIPHGCGGKSRDSRSRSRAALPLVCIANALVSFASSLCVTRTLTGDDALAHRGLRVHTHTHTHTTRFNIGKGPETRRGVTLQRFRVLTFTLGAQGRLRRRARRCAAGRPRAQVRIGWAQGRPRGRECRHAGGRTFSRVRLGGAAGRICLIRLPQFLQNRPILIPELRQSLCLKCQLLGSVDPVCGVFK